MRMVASTTGEDVEYRMSNSECRMSKEETLFDSQLRHSSFLVRCSTFHEIATNMKLQGGKPGQPYGIRTVPMPELRRLVPAYGPQGGSCAAPYDKPMINGKFH